MAGEEDLGVAPPDKPRHAGSDVRDPVAHPLPHPASDRDHALLHIWHRQVVARVPEVVATHVQREVGELTCLILLRYEQRRATVEVATLAVKVEDRNVTTTAAFGVEGSCKPFVDSVDGDVYELCGPGTGHGGVSSTLIDAGLPVTRGQSRSAARIVYDIVRLGCRR